GERMRTILQLFSANRFVGVISGATVTAVIQSSSASTVMVIGFVNAGLLSLVQAISIIFGANIGTTITAQLVAFDISWIIMPSIILGLILSFIPKASISNWSETIIGLGFLFLGMEMMSSELKTLSNDASFREAFQIFKCSPVNGVIPPIDLLGAIAVGMITTFIIQSSSACSGIVIALGASGLVDIYTAVALVLGSNIGTTITAQLAAIPTNRIAKQAALAHTLFNTIGVVIIVCTMWITIDDKPIFFKAVEWLSPESTLPRQIANAHTLFNVFTTSILLAFVPTLAKICEKVIPVGKGKVRYQRLEPSLLSTPPIALTQAASALRKMLKKSWKMADCTLNIYNKNDEKNQEFLKSLDNKEDDVDTRQKDITQYLAKLMQCELTEEEAEQIPMLLHCTNDAERIGDLAENIQEIMSKIKLNKYSFSQNAEIEYNDLHQKLESLAQCAIVLLEAKSQEASKNAVKIRTSIVETLNNVEAEHVSRVNAGTCRPEIGILYLELLESIRKVAKNLFNIIDRAGKFYDKIPSVRRNVENIK
ncbi:MAG: Na/Pi cotransporter family protein, partial [Opitutales bacterium]|nr:Na/Pi cotransporter family protein [Opitutales bacterium]